MSFRHRIMSTESWVAKIGQSAFPLAGPAAGAALAPSSFCQRRGARENVSVTMILWPARNLREAVLLVETSALVSEKSPNRRSNGSDSLAIPLPFWFQFHRGRNETPGSPTPNSRQGLHRWDFVLNCLHVHTGAVHLGCVGVLLWMR
jgi:hypothetical protein